MRAGPRGYLYMALSEPETFQVRTISSLDSYQKRDKLRQKEQMAKKYYALSSVENNKLVKIIQIVFGIVCFSVAVFWLVFNIRSLKTDGTLWITVIFLTGFGFYQVWSGIGKATRFIEISEKLIRLKKTIILAPVDIHAGEIQKIDIYPFNLIFFLKSQKKIILRFGASYQETNEDVKDDILVFGDENSIEVEIVEEKV
jgi:hypothetical protein